MLHIINKSPWTHSALKNCLQFASNQDVILLIEDGVYAGIEETEFAKKLSDFIICHSLYALKSDLEARGIANKIHPGVLQIDYQQFVDLTIHHYPIQAWS